MNFVISSQNTIDEHSDNNISDVSCTDYPKSIPSHCGGLLVLHLCYKNKLFSRIRNVMAKDVNEAMAVIDIGMDILKKEVEKFKSECELGNDSDNSVSKSKNACSYNSEYMGSNLEENSMSISKEECDPSIENIQEIERNSQCSFIDTKEQFKSPVDVSQNARHRMSSSTTSSSNNSNSILKSRPSTTSTFTHSDVSELKTNSDEQIISETPDSDADTHDKQNEITIIEKEEESESEENIYAKWKSDKYFYSGKVKAVGPECEVIFDDNSSAMVKISDVYFKERLPKDTEVSVDIEGDGKFIKNFIIKKHIDIPKFGAKPEKGYNVFNQVTNDFFDVSRKSVSVHMAIVRKLMGKYIDLDTSLNDSLDASNISMENIIYGKRDQRKKRFSQFVTYDKPKMCHSPSIRHLSESPYIPKKKQKIFDSHLIKLEKGPRKIGIFTNCYFMVTGEHDEDNLTISKDSVEQNIIENNGRVIEIPTIALMKQYKNNECQLFLVIIGEQSQTVKFMMTLAIGEVPIVPTKWLLECIENSRLLQCDQYLLSRGIIGDNESISINLRAKSKPGIFANKIIWIVTDNAQGFGTSWQNILELAEADVFLMDTARFSFGIDKQNCDFVIVERDGITNNFLRKLKNLGLNILDYSFATNCLISNSLLSMENYIL